LQVCLMQCIFNALEGMGELAPHLVPSPTMPHSVRPAHSTPPLPSPFQMVVVLDCRGGSSVGMTRHMGLLKKFAVTVTQHFPVSKLRLFGQGSGASGLLALTASYSISFAWSCLAPDEPGPSVPTVSPPLRFTSSPADRTASSACTCWSCRCCCAGRCMPSRRCCTPPLARKSSPALSTTPSCPSLSPSCPRGQRGVAVGQGGAGRPSADTTCCCLVVAAACPLAWLSRLRAVLL